VDPGVAKTLLEDSLDPVGFYFDDNFSDISDRMICDVWLCDTYLPIPQSRVLPEKLTSKLCS
jgi:hypothetical protein